MTFVDGGGLLTTVASNITTVKDLAGKKVGIIPNTTTDKALSSTLTAGAIQATLIAVKEHNEGLRGLQEGKFDAYASDRLLLAGLLTNAPDAAKLRLSPEIFSYEPYALMMRRGDNAFQAAVNRFLSSLYRSGGIIKIYEKWFGPYASAGPLVKALYLLHSWPD
jgi:ABC-type amino acid transport substrate-binding protein